MGLIYTKYNYIYIYIYLHILYIFFEFTGKKGLDTQCDISQGSAPLIRCENIIVEMSGGQRV